MGRLMGSSNSNNYRGALLLFAVEESIVIDHIITDKIEISAINFFVCGQNQDL